MTLLLGIDVGRTALEVVAMDTRSGAIEASTKIPHSTTVPHPGFAEQHVEDYARSCGAALIDVVAALGERRRTIAAMAVTGAHATVLLDGGGDPVGGAVTEMDQRSGAICTELTASVDADALRTTGRRAEPGLTVPTLLWLQQHQPEQLARAKTVFTPKDYVGYWLTGKIASDPSAAAKTLAFDGATGRWSTTLLDHVELASSLFPGIDSSIGILGDLLPEHGETLGLTGLPVIRGASDDSAIASSLGVCGPPLGSLVLNTRSELLLPQRPWRVDERWRFAAQRHLDECALVGRLSSTEATIDWYGNVLCDGERLAAEMRGDDAFDLICDAASTSQPGARGLVYLPGERSALIGMTPAHDKADVSRAVLEGMAFEVAGMLRTTTAPEQLRIGGALADKPFWRQLLADIVGCEVCTTTSPASAAHGAALMAGCGAGVFDSIDQACERLVHPTARSYCDQVSHHKYETVRAAGLGLRHDLQAHMTTLAALDDS